MARHTSTEAHEVPTSQLSTGPGTGGDILVDLMRREGVDVAFGVISIHNMPLVEAVDRDLRFVPVRHEAAAVNAADGYARATGRVGVAITSTGTGAGNAAGAMLEALVAQSRVLHITGNIDSAHLGEERGMYHEVPRQLQMLGAVSGTTLRVEDRRHARRVLTQALRALDTHPPEPVSVDWPIDLQYTADPDRQAAAQDRRPDPVHPHRRDLGKAIKVMRKARRPLIWAGGGARRVGPALTELAQEWGAGVLTGGSGRGAVPEDHPLCLGNFAAEDGLQDLIGRADCLLTVGSHLRAHETRNFQVPLPGRHVQIDLDEDALGRNYPVTVGLRADTTLTVPALLSSLTATRTRPDWRDEVQAARAQARQSHRGDLGAYSEICDALRTRLPRSAPLVRDVTVPASSWGNRLLEVYDVTSNIFAVGGGIGQGLAMAIGAAAARPGDPVLAMVGDGGLAVHLGELAVLAAEQPRVVLVLFNDGGYGVLRNMQEAKESAHRAVDLFTPDFGLLARAVDLPYEKVGETAGFDRALAQALDRSGPSVIEIDVPALRPAPADFVPPTTVP